MGASIHLSFLKALQELVQKPGIFWATTLFQPFKDFLECLQRRYRQKQGAPTATSLGALVRLG